MHSPLTFYFVKNASPFIGERDSYIFDNKSIFSYRFKERRPYMKLESAFQHDLIEKLKNIFPGCIITKNDPDYIQGIPDLTIFYGKHWATLECKRSAHERHRPNQDYYVDKMNNMSYSSFVYPDNEQQVIEDLIKLFKGENINDLERSQKL